MQWLSPRIKTRAAAFALMGLAAGAANAAKGPPLAIIFPFQGEAKTASELSRATKQQLLSSGLIDLIPYSSESPSVSRAVSELRVTASEAASPDTAAVQAKLARAMDVQ